MESLARAMKAVAAEPMAIVMGLVAIGCVIVATAPRTRGRDRILTAAVALISAAISLVMASHWRGPS